MKNMHAVGSLRDLLHNILHCQSVQLQTSSLETPGRITFCQQICFPSGSHWVFLPHSRAQLFSSRILSHVPLFPSFLRCSLKKKGNSIPVIFEFLNLLAASLTGFCWSRAGSEFVPPISVFEPRHFETLFLLSFPRCLEICKLHGSIKTDTVIMPQNVLDDWLPPSAPQPQIKSAVTFKSLL